MIPVAELEYDAATGTATWRRGGGVLSRAELGWVRAALRDGVIGGPVRTMRVVLGSRSDAFSAAGPLEFIGAEAWSSEERVSSGMKVTRREDFGM